MYIRCVYNIRISTEKGPEYTYQIFNYTYFWRDICMGEGETKETHIIQIFDQYALFYN